MRKCMQRVSFVACFHVARDHSSCSCRVWSHLNVPGGRENKN